MIAFTAIGLLVFWSACFNLGLFLAWCADSGGIVMGVARVLVGMDAVSVSLHSFIAAANTEATKPQEKNDGR